MTGTLDSQNIRVAVIDDHPTIREALTYAINDQLDMRVCGQADSAGQGFDLVMRERPDVAVVDLMLGDGYGLDLVTNLRAYQPSLGIMVFSLFDEAIYAERALRAGALSYLMKSESTKSVVEAIRYVRRGDVYLSETMRRRMLNNMMRPGRQPTHAIENLSDRELAVLQFMGQGYVVSEIQEHLNLSRKTVETYRRRACEKLGYESSNELLQFAVHWVHGQGKATAASPPLAY